MKFGLQLSAMAIGVLAIVSASAAPLSGADYLAPHLKLGRSYSNVFSIAHSIKAEGYDEYVRRNGGSADYTITAANADSWRFRQMVRYDGQTPDAQEAEIRDGGRTICSNSKCTPSTEGTGLVYNPMLWGTPPKHLSAGVTWTVQIDAPWELGGPRGTQTITVVRVDSDGTATLMREGTSGGLFEDEPAQVKMIRGGQTIELERVPGVTHWKGYATFSKGVVIADELLVTRTDVLRSQDGQEVTAFDRRIMLLIASPPSPPVNDSTAR
jgi:hypothetical protein